MAQGIFHFIEAPRWNQAEWDVSDISEVLQAATCSAYLSSKSAQDQLQKW